MSHDRESETDDIETYTLTIRLDAEHLAKIRIRRLGNGVIIVRPPPPPPRLHESTLTWELDRDLMIETKFELLRG